MRLQKIQTNHTFQAAQTMQPQRHEFIDSISKAVRNPHDVNDCVAVPRGIFKAYMYIMGGASLLAIAAALPAKFKIAKTALNIAGAVSNFISAIYFAKPFFVKGLSPTVKREDVNN